jgi:hypothetical protein
MTTEFRIHHMLWKYDHKSDKVWGVIEAGDNLYSFWGRRTARIQFKFHGAITSDKLLGLARMQERKTTTGYKILAQSEIGAMAAEIGLRKQLVNSKLLDKVR